MGLTSEGGQLFYRQDLPEWMKNLPTQKISLAYSLANIPELECPVHDQPMIKVMVRYAYGVTALITADGPGYACLQCDVEYGAGGFRSFEAGMIFKQEVLAILVERNDPGAESLRRFIALQR